MKLFDKKFGDAFRSVPSKPGVYTFRGEDGSPVYVGKAANLRRRLGEYRRARRGKMRKIVSQALELTWELCDSDLDACLLELRQIQQARPKLNIAGAFSFRYPFIGLRIQPKEWALCFTTTPEVFSTYPFYGAFRSRYLTAEAFFSLLQLLQFVGHRSKTKTNKKPYSYEFALRQLPASWSESLNLFLRGQSGLFLEELSLKLLENAGARSKASQVQEQIDHLVRFWEQECVPLAKAIATVTYPDYPVPQKERDPLFIRAGFQTSEEPHELDSHLATA